MRKRIDVLSDSWTNQSQLSQVHYQIDTDWYMLLKSEESTFARWDNRQTRHRASSIQDHGGRGKSTDQRDRRIVTPIIQASLERISAGPVSARAQRRANKWGRISSALNWCLARLNVVMPRFIHQKNGRQCLKEHPFVHARYTVTYQRSGRRTQTLELHPHEN